MNIDQKEMKDNKIENAEETTLQENYDYENSDYDIDFLWHRRNRMQCFTN